MNCNNNKAISTFNNAEQRVNIEPEFLEKRVREHEALLYKIAISLGYFDNDVSDLVYQVCSYATRHYADKENRLSLRVWLSKMMVHKCIYGISSKLFSQGYDLSAKPVFNQHYSGYSFRQEAAALNMPLSFRAVYALHQLLRFDEIEIAAILNIDVVSVKKRLNKALLFINIPPG
jgi:DNA-directed RNA polymerase specialized sigma24 family protein